MRKLRKAATSEVSPDWGLFVLTGLMEGRGSGSIASGEIVPSDDRVTAGHDGLIIRTENIARKVHVRCELWDGPPPPHAWEELWTGRLRLESGLVGVTGWKVWTSTRSSLSCNVTPSGRFG